MQEDFRCDGRTRLDYRPMEVETDVVSHASGSARLRLANTDILVGVKTEIDTPYPERPREGKIEFFVDWYAVIVLFSYVTFPWHIDGDWLSCCLACWWGLAVLLFA